MWARVARTSSLAAVIMSAAVLTGAAAIAQVLPEDATVREGKTVSGPIQDFNWLNDQSLLKDALKDDDDDGDDDDDDDDNEGGEVRIQENRTTTTTTTTVTQVRYTDLAANYWASDFVYRLSAIKVVSGFPGGMFMPSNNLTQAQFAAMVAKAFQRPQVRDVVMIRNLSRNYWAYQSIQTAYSMGFINISNGSFNPNASMTRLDMLVQLARGLGITQVSAGQSVDQLLSVFTDASSIPSEYRVIIAALVERGVLVNYPQVRTLNLYQTVTRAEACGFVYQSLAYLGKVEKVQSAYIVNTSNVSTTTTNTTTTTTDTSTEVDDDDDDDDDGDDDDGRDRQNCNQGIGNGSEGCDPGNSRPHGGSNDEGGRTPGNR